MSIFTADCSRQFLRNKGNERKDHVLGPSELHQMYEDFAAVQNQWAITEDNANGKAKINGRRHVYVLSIRKWVVTLLDKVLTSFGIQIFG